jgi:hypothetical protein
VQILHTVENVAADQHKTVSPLVPYPFRALSKTYGQMWLRCDVADAMPG